MKLFDEAKYKTKKELFDFLTAEKDTLIAQKKATIKHADGISAYIQNIAIKANKAALSNKDEIQVKAVINTTNILDSHGDVHLPGIWDKSLKERKNIMHLQEHQMQFDKIIASKEDVKASVHTYDWKDLGYNYNGKTDALVFDSNVKSSRNKYMFDLYKQGYVDNHSVGMQYVKIELAINDEDYADEFAVWNKYINQVANKQDAEDNGYFWAVKEAKVIEGSAVPIGSNSATPTLEVKEPGNHSDKHIEPEKSTLSKEDITNIFKSIL